MWVVKDNTNGRYLNQIHDEIPMARFLHIVRDGRAVLNSMVGTIEPYGNGEVMARDPLTAARNWRNLVSRIGAFSKQHADLVLEVKYEDLVECPQEQLDRIRQFMGLETAAAPSLAGAEGYYSRIPDKEKGIHSLLKKEPLKVRSRAWMNELPETSRALFEHIAGDTLVSKGYSDVGRIKWKDLLARPHLMREYMRSVVRRYISWIGYLFNPDLLRKTITVKFLRQRDARAFEDRKGL